MSLQPVGQPGSLETQAGVDAVIFFFFFDAVIMRQNFFSGKPKMLLLKAFN